MRCPTMTAMQKQLKLVGLSPWVRDQNLLNLLIYCTKLVSVLKGSTSAAVKEWKTWGTRNLVSAGKQTLEFETGEEGRRG